MARRYKLHPDAPAALQREFRKLGKNKSLSALARQKGVNVRYVYDALINGIRPVNPAIARMLGFDVKHVKFGDRRSRHMRWWFHKLNAQQRNKAIFDLYHYREDE